MLDTAPDYPLAWRPDRGLDKSIESIGSDCLIMSNDPRNAADPEVECLTEKRRGWFLDEGKIAQRQAEIAAERERSDAEFLEWCEQVGGRFGVCYFLGDDKIVKIGFSTKLAQRLNYLRSNSGPIVLRHLATAPGGRERERYYHSLFAEHRCGGEWFTRCPEIDAEIERLSL